MQILRHPAQMLLHDAQSRLPEVAGGLIGGSGEVITQVVALTNVASEPNSDFCLDADELRSAIQRLRSHDCDLLGIYRSFPDKHRIEAVDFLRMVSSLQGAWADARAYRYLLGVVLDTKGRLELHAFTHDNEGLSEIAIDLCEDGQPMPLAS